MEKDETTVRAADSLAKLIFLDTNDAASVQISLPFLQTSGELFFLLLDLFIRGLLLLFAGERQSDGQEGIAVHNITQQQFDTLAAKLRVAGVECKRTVVEATTAVRGASTNIDLLMRSSRNLPLERYRLVARTRGYVYTMWFTIIHNVRPGDRLCAGSFHRR